MRRIEYEGRKAIVECLFLADGSCPAGDFLDALSDSDRRKLDVLFEMMGDHGEIRNREKFKKLKDTDGLFEFKSFQVRLPCFFVPGLPRRVMLLFGLTKKGDNLKPADVRRAEAYRTWFLG